MGIYEVVQGTYGTSNVVALIADYERDNFPSRAFCICEHLNSRSIGDAGNNLRNDIKKPAHTGTDEPRSEIAAGGSTKM
jgi:hypothetical protein